jgi:hypothetical protein
MIMTQLPENECAIVSTDGMRGLEVLIPDLNDDTEMPTVAAFLMACAMRFYEDKQFVEEQIAWLNAHRRIAGGIGE